MRTVLIHAMQMYRRASHLWRRIRGRSASDEAAALVQRGTVWDEFCDTVNAAAAVLDFPGAPDDAFNRAEGFRYLSRLIRAGLEQFVEYQDPAFPELRRMVHETVKMGADNPDNYYQNCVIDGRYDYRIEGTRGTVALLSFASKSGHYGQGGGMPPVDEIDARDLTIDEGGRIDLMLSPRQHPGNWLRIAEGPGLLIVRQTFLDRENEQRADLRIRCLNGPTSPEPLRPEQLVDGLRQASLLVAGASALFARWSQQFQRHTNRLPLFDPEVSVAAGGDPNIAYYMSHWALKPDEALVIETAIPDPCPYWNFQLNNYWMESLDYRYHRVHINRHTATYEPDGSVRVIVAHQDPGHPNWIETAGHTQGTMCWRWIHTAERPEPATRVVRLQELRRELQR